MIEFNFKQDIEDFLNQNSIIENDFDVFKVKYCLSYQLKDKEQLIVVLKKIQSYFKNGVYKGPLNISDLLPNKSQTKNLRSVKSKNNVARAKKPSKKLKRKTTKEQGITVLQKKIAIRPRKAPKHTEQYYKLLRLKQRFLGKDLELHHIADYYHYHEIDLLNNLNVAFKNIDICSKITEDHLEYISKELYYKLQEVKKDKETVITKTPQTKPNYFKIIYTR